MSEVANEVWISISSGELTEPVPLPRHLCGLQSGYDARVGQPSWPAARANDHTAPECLICVGAVAVVEVVVNDLRSWKTFEKISTIERRNELQCENAVPSPAAHCSH